MSDETNGIEESNEFSLADLARVDVSEVAEVNFGESLPAGVYEFKGTNAELVKKDNREGEARGVVELEMEITEVKSVIDKKITDEAKEKLVGRKHKHRMYIVPEDWQTGVGAIRAFYRNIDLPNEGAMGGVEGIEPGFVDGFVDHVFTCKIVARPNPQDRTQFFAELKPEVKKP